MADVARIIEIVEPEVAALGFDLVRVKFIGSEAGEGEKTLQIMAEDPATGQLVLDQCAAISRRVSDRIDALEEAGEVLIDDAYRLEVSSPGIDRPLTRPKDYRNWARHEAKLSLSEPVDGNRKALRGELAGLDGNTVLFDDTKSGRLTIPLAHIESARLVLTDNLIAATRPIDMADAEDVFEEEES
ncbi:MAG: ribosome maturation protein RimP [Alphaproteobacteria bacterium]|nr:ribosome maturation protein RimP [Alphaproteobacteria bacterium]